MSRPFTEERLAFLLTRTDGKTFWRHDVDASLEAATKMAQLEQELEVSATYYLMIDSPFYEPADAFVIGQIIQAMGHEVGWHLDERRWPPSDAPNAMDFRIKCSFHCPTEAVLWRRFSGIDSAYDPIWKGRYYADSRGRFAYGDPEDDASGQTLQINLHPEWWFDPGIHELISDREYEEFFHEPRGALAAQP